MHVIDTISCTVPVTEYLVTGTSVYLKIRSPEARFFFGTEEEFEALSPVCGAPHTTPSHLEILQHLLLAAPAALVRTHVVFYRSGRAYRVRPLGPAH